MKTKILDKSSYDKDRLSRAVKKATLANLASVGQAEDFASRVVAKIESWLENKTEFTGNELRLQTAETLSDYDPDAAYFYANEKRMF